MESLAVALGNQLKESLEADDAYCRARGTLESEWLETESAVADLMGQAVRSINMFVTNAEFHIDRFETNLEGMTAHERSWSRRNRKPSRNSYRARVGSLRIKNARLAEHIDLHLALGGRFHYCDDSCFHICVTVRHNHP